MLESTSYYLFENETVEVCMMLNANLEREVHFTIVTLPGSAQENYDYIAIKSQVIAYPGDENICFFVETLEDDLVEGDEMLELTLGGNDPALIMPELNAITITIKDNDSKCIVALINAIINCIHTYYIDAVFGLEKSEYTVGDNESNLTVAVHLIAGELASHIKLKLTSMDGSASKHSFYQSMIDSFLVLHSS